MRVGREIMRNSITQQPKRNFGSGVYVGEIPAILTWVQNNGVHRSFCPMIFDAKEEH